MLQFLVMLCSQKRRADENDKQMEMYNITEQMKASIPHDVRTKNEFAQDLRDSLPEVETSQELCGAIPMKVKKDRNWLYIHFTK